ncbi:efflux RND transporter periplasmic adaptor subunit [Psychromicrobium sp. YIM B11713]|uniref:efflux RND transporter periplasmic adaptor subunit n=1 Tax=Psychromicrobium sp. YIM B11713 TaxID=3145233 RepID=UPI00374F0E93
MLSKTALINTGIGVLILGLATGSFLIINHSTASNTETVRTVAVSRQDLSAVSTANGNVSPASTTVLNAQTCTGAITSLSTAVGQQVHPGQLLATIDPSTAQNALSAAQAQLDSAQAQVTAQSDSAANQIAQAQQNLSNAQQSATLDASQQTAAVSAAQAQLTADDNALQSAEQGPSQQAIATAQAAVAKDASALVQAKNAQASGSLKDQQSVANAQTQLGSAQNTSVNSAGITSAQLAVDTAKKNLAACKLTAPVAGTVTAVTAVVGGNAGSASTGNGASSGTATSSSTNSSSTGLITISDTAHLQVTANFAESDVAALKVGDSASFSFPALKLDGKTAITGKVTAIAATASTTNNVVSYPVTVAINNPPSGLKLGQSANIGVTTATAAQALSIPTLAISSSGGKQTVQLESAGSDKTVTVTTGITAGGNSQILSGLQEGDRVVLPAITSSTDGSTTPTGGNSGRNGNAGFGGAGGRSRG